MKTYFVPDQRSIPPNGGVRQHCEMLYKHLTALGVEIARTDIEADVTHVQSAYATSGRIDVYTCHGGFLPTPIYLVYQNLRKAKVIISVARWIVDRFFPEFAFKTVVIPNGVDLTEWEPSTLPHNALGLEPGYLLTKGYNAKPHDWLMVYEAARRNPHLKFVSLGCPIQASWLDNLLIVSTPRPHAEVKDLLNDCLAYISPSSEVNPVLVMEAWAARKPVLAYNIDGNREVIEETQSLGGFVYNTVGDLCDYIEGVKEFGKEAGAAGRETVEKFFDWRQLARQTLQIYETWALLSRA